MALLDDIKEYMAKEWDAEMLIDSDYEEFDEVVDAVHKCITDFYESCTDILKDGKFETAASFGDDCDEDNQQVAYVGSILAIAPSGKYYTGWTSNQTTLDELMDETFWEFIAKLLPDVWFEGGEGDPTDLYMCRWCE